MGLARFSRRTIARKAVTYAVAHIDDYAAKLAEAVDLPALDEGEEREAFTLAIKGGLLVMEDLLSGQDIDVAMPFSKRQLVSAAVDLAQDNTDEILILVLDDAGWETTLRDFAAPLIYRAMDKLSDWVDETPLLG